MSGWHDLQRRWRALQPWRQAVPSTPAPAGRQLTDGFFRFPCEPRDIP
jgi:hypothetical protein